MRVPCTEKQISHIQAEVEPHQGKQDENNLLISFLLLISKWHLSKAEF
jgi:hypothetical protein